MNERVLHNELKKLDPDAKRQLAESLLADLEDAEKPATPIPVAVA